MKTYFTQKGFPYYYRKLYISHIFDAVINKQDFNYFVEENKHIFLTGLTMFAELITHHAACFQFCYRL